MLNDTRLQIIDPYLDTLQTMDLTLVLAKQQLASPTHHAACSSGSGRILSMSSDPSSSFASRTTLQGLDPIKTKLWQCLPGSSSRVADRR